jgi:ketosteroid isomerase-like protein
MGAWPEAATGGCLCGAVRYRAAGAPEGVIYCHCESCRSHAGAPVVALAGYAAAQITYTSGAPRHHASSPGVARAFCGACGTPLTWEGEGLIEILVATLDAPEAFAPALHIHHDERLAWFDTGDTLPRYAVWHDDGGEPAVSRPAAAEAQIALVTRYFAAVDGEDLDAVLDTLTDDCHFTVETHNVALHGKTEISAMFRRLWANHRAVRHIDFRFVPDPGGDRISAQFRVENTEHDGSLTTKSNCNFFDLADGRFSRVAVYMAGPNTLDHA